MKKGPKQKNRLRLPGEKESPFSSKEVRAIAVWVSMVALGIIANTKGGFHPASGSQGSATVVSERINIDDFKAGDLKSQYMYTTINGSLSPELAKNLSSFKGEVLAVVVNNGNIDHQAAINLCEYPGKLGVGVDNGEITNRAYRVFQGKCKSSELLIVENGRPLIDRTGANANFPSSSLSAQSTH